MRLFEFDGNTEDLELVVAIDQLKIDLDSGKVDPEMTVDQLLDYFMEHDIILDISDLYNMINESPLDQVISNINDKNVEFKGFEKKKDLKTDKDVSSNTVKQMAKRAMK